MRPTAYELVRGLVVEEQQLAQRLEQVRAALGAVKRLAGLQTSAPKKRRRRKVRDGGARAEHRQSGHARAVVQEVRAPSIASPATRAPERPRLRAVVKCGACGGAGHNRRGCMKAADTPKPVAAPVAPVTDRLRAIQAEAARRSAPKPIDEDDVSAIEDLEDDFHPAAKIPKPERKRASPPGAPRKQTRVTRAQHEAAALPPRSLVECTRCTTKVIDSEVEKRGHLGRAHGLALADSPGAFRAVSRPPAAAQSGA